MPPYGVYEKLSWFLSIDFNIVVLMKEKTIVLRFGKFCDPFECQLIGLAKMITLQEQKSGQCKCFMNVKIKAWELNGILPIEWNTQRAAFHILVHCSPQVRNSGSLEMCPHSDNRKELYFWIKYFAKDIYSLKTMRGTPFCSMIFIWFCMLRICCTTYLTQTQTWPFTN